MLSLALAKRYSDTARSGEPMVWGTGTLLCSIIIIQDHIKHRLLDNYIATLWYPYTLYLVPSTALAQKAKAKLEAANLAKIALYLANKKTT